MATESFGIEMYEKAIADKRVPMYRVDWLNFWIRPIVFTFFVLAALIAPFFIRTVPMWFVVFQGLLIIFFIMTESSEVRKQFEALTFDFVNRVSSIDVKRQIVLQLQRDYKWQLIRSDRQSYKFI